MLRWLHQTSVSQTAIQTPTPPLPAILLPASAFFVQPDPNRCIVRVLDKCTCSRHQAGSGEYECGCGCGCECGCGCGCGCEQSHHNVDSHITPHLAPLSSLLSRTPNPTTRCYANNHVARPLKGEKLKRILDNLKPIKPEDGARSTEILYEQVDEILGGK